MLVLSRKLGQQMMLPSLDLLVTVLAIEGNRVRLGITAPESVAVNRLEVRALSCKPSPDTSPDA